MTLPFQRCLPLLVLCLCARFYAAPVFSAEPAGEPQVVELAPMALPAALADLDAANPAKRDAATVNLMVRDDLTKEQLTQALQESKTPERRQRLIRVATHRFYASVPAPHGGPDHDGGSLGVSLGIDMGNGIVQPTQNPTVQTPAVFIIGTVPGFPANAYLRPGDLITAVDGEPFKEDIDLDKFRMRIKNCGAGQFMTLDVLRDGQKLRYKIRLDSAYRLDSIHGPIPVQQQQVGLQFEKYLQELSAKAEPVAKIQLDFPAPPAGSPAAQFEAAMKAQAAANRLNGMVQMNLNGQNIIINRGNIIFGPGVVRQRIKIGN